jgi:hypothetical protein
VPPAAHGFPVRLARAARAGRDGGYLEPRVVFEQYGEPLAHHTGAAGDADFKFAIHKINPLKDILYSMLIRVFRTI